MESVEDKAYLSNKRVILNSPGTSYMDNYYSVMNSSSSLVETTYAQGRYTASLSSLGFGTTSNINIPNESFIGETYLTITVPDVVANQTLERGWGYALLANLAYLMGSSNTSQINFTGPTIWMMVCAQCDSEEQRSELWTLGGDEILAPTGGPISATMLLPLPFSNACKKIPFDSSLLTNNIVLTISIKQASAIYGGSGAVPNSLISGLIQFRQGDLSNKSLSLKGALATNPALQLSYPFTHFQSFNSPSFPGVTVGNGTAQVNLTQFINSDLLGIAFYVLKNTDAVPVGGNSPSTFNTADISNITITYNGQIMYLAPGQSYKVFNMHGAQGASYFMNTVIRPGNVATFNSDAVNSYFVFVDFSHYRSPCDQGHLFNVFRLSNQSLQLTFNTPDTSQYTLYATYMYNAVCEIQNGQSFLYFD